MDIYSETLGKSGAGDIGNGDWPSAHKVHICFPDLSCLHRNHFFHYYYILHLPCHVISNPNRKPSRCRYLRPQRTGSALNDLSDLICWNSSSMVFATFYFHGLIVLGDHPLTGHQ